MSCRLLRELHQNHLCQGCTEPESGVEAREKAAAQSSTESARWARSGAPRRTHVNSWVSGTQQAYRGSRVPSDGTDTGTQGLIRMWDVHVSS